MVIFLSKINYTIFSAVFQVVMLAIAHGFMLYYPHINFIFHEAILKKLVSKSEKSTLYERKEG